MKNILPNNTTVAVRLSKLIKPDERRALSERLSSRMIRLAAALPEGGHIGWQMTVPEKGPVCMLLYGSASLSKNDLEWAADKTAKTSTASEKSPNIGELGRRYELVLPVTESRPLSRVGFTAGEQGADRGFSMWPLSYSTQFAELVDALRIFGGVFRAALGPADAQEQARCREHTLRTFTSNQLDVNSYIGRPVRARFLLRLSGEPSVRLLSVLDEAVPGVKLRSLCDFEKAADDIMGQPLGARRRAPRLRRPHNGDGAEPE